MRRVPLSMLTPNMRLGRSVYLQDCILLREGTYDLQRYVTRLKSLGIDNLYIEDTASEGIILDEAVSFETKRKCRNSLQKVFDKMESSFTVDTKQISATVELLMSEILSHTDMLLNLTDIGVADDSTLTHSINTTIYAVFMGIQLGYGKSEILDLGKGIILHDVGKTAIDQQILLKTEKLSEEEFEHIKLHTTLGYEILRNAYSISEKSRMISLCHHEKMDGSGYPNGMYGNEIPEFSRIASIVDIYEALTADRCYRAALTPLHASEILMKESATKLDVELVSKFMQNISVYPNGMMVRLSDGTYGIIKAQNVLMPLRPVVRRMKLMDHKQVGEEEVDLMRELNLTIIESGITRLHV